MDDAIIVYGNPIAKKRPRFSRRGKHVVTYNEQEKEEESFRNEVFHQLKSTEPCNSPMRVFLQFWMKRPKSHFRTGKYSGILKEAAPKIHVGRPDVDNLIKFVFDALNGLVWTDDCIIYSIGAFKLYCEEPKTIIRFE